MQPGAPETLGEIQRQCMTSYNVYFRLNPFASKKTVLLILDRNLAISKMRHLFFRPNVLTNIGKVKSESRLIGHS